MPAEMRDSYGNWHSVDEVVNTGGEQTIRLLGPFRVNFNTANITSANGVVAFALEANQILLRARCEVITAWDAHIDNAQLLMLVGGADHASGDMYDYVSWLIGSNVTTTIDANNAPEAPIKIGTVDALVADTVYGVNWSQRNVTTGAIRVRVTGTDGATEGAADVYALIAEPAS